MAITAVENAMERSTDSRKRRALRRMTGRGIGAVFLAGIAGGQALAVDHVWEGGNGNWGTANWTNGVPNDSSANAYIDQNNPVSSTVTLDNNYTVNSLTISTGDELEVTTNPQTDDPFTLTVPTINNAGTIDVNAEHQAFDAPFTLSGSIVNSGTLSATDTGNTANHFVLAPGAGGLINTGTIVTMSVKLGHVAFGGFITLDGSGGGTFTNTNGVIESTGFTAIALVNDATVVGGAFETDLPDVQGAIQIGSSTSALLGATLENVTNNGLLQTTTGNILAVTGTLTNNGSILPVGNMLLGGGDVTLGGTGTTQLSSAVNVPEYIYGNTAGARFTIGNSQTVYGIGTIGHDSGGNGGIALTNNGTIYATYSLAVDPSSGGAINNGIFRAQGGGTFDVNNTLGGTTTNDGTFDVEDNSTLSVATGALTNYNAATTTLTGGTYVVNSTGDVTTLSLGGGPISTNAATVSLNGTGAKLTGVASLAVNSGSFSISNGFDFSTQSALTNSGSILIGNGSTLTVNGAISGTGTLNVLAGGLVALSKNGGGNSENSLSIAGSGKLDLNNNHLLINYGSGPDPIVSVAAWILSGYNGGAWNGAGIDSSVAAANPGNYGIGYADSADPGNPAGLASGQIEIMYTLLGDANLDGKVNGTDFNILAANFNTGGDSWDQGDFNYDGKVNGSDFNVLAANFNQGASQSADLSALDSFAAANGLLVDVPEPATAAMTVIAGMEVLRRRRRSSRQ